MDSFCLERAGLGAGACNLIAAGCSEPRCRPQSSRDWFGLGCTGLAAAGHEEVGTLGSSGRHLSSEATRAIGHLAAALGGRMGC